MCPGQPRAFKRSNTGVSVGITFFFLNEPVSMTPRHVCKKLPAKTPRCDCVWPIFIKSYVTSKVDPILKLCNYKATTQITHVSAQTHKCSCRFLHIDPEKLQTCSTIRVCFFVRNLGCLMAQISPPQNDQISGAKKKKKAKTPFGSGLTGARRARVQKFRIYLPKRREFLTLRWFGSFILNQLVMRKPIYDKPTNWPNIVSSMFTCPPAISPAKISISRSQ